MGEETIVFNRGAWHVEKGLLLEIVKMRTVAIRAHQNWFLTAIFQGGIVFFASICKIYVPWMPTPYSLLPQAVLRLGWTFQPLDIVRSFISFLIFDYFGTPIPIFFRPTFGYAIGCLLGALALSWILKRFKVKTEIQKFKWALMAHLPIYILGAIGLVISLGMTLRSAIVQGIFPFIGMDCVKTFILIFI